MNPNWQRYQEFLCVVDTLGITLDPSRMGFTRPWLESMAPKMTRAFDAMEALEKGAIANPDEKRKVGHYWLRAPELAPPEDAAAISPSSSHPSRCAMKPPFEWPITKMRLGSTLYAARI